MIEREIRVAARPETVFAFWTDPAKMARWMGRDIRLDARPGGTLRIDYNGSDIASGDVRRARPADPDRARRGAGRPPGDATPPGASTVEVDFVPDGDGTIVRLRHSGLVEEAVSGHAEGWDQFLPSLVAAVARLGGAGPLPGAAARRLIARMTIGAPRSSASAATTSSGRPVPSSGWIRVRIRSTIAGGSPATSSAAISGRRSYVRTVPPFWRSRGSRSCASSRSTAPATSASRPGSSTATSTS